jgi:6,7-dimethyl-8-ribityllumazine synthase
MVFKKKNSEPASVIQYAANARVLIIASPYYEKITSHLAAGAIEVLTAHSCSFDRIDVPGALEIPQALRQAVEAGLIGGAGKTRYAGAIALGCVIRGETSHYDIVCNNANHWLMESVIHHNIPFGNAILTVDTKAQALARAKGGASGKGGDAARACLSLIALASQFADSQASRT